MTVELGPLPPGALPAARALLVRALPLDDVGPVAKEKLFGPSPPPLAGWTLAAWRAGTLIGVAAGAGRWLRVLAVDPAARERGVGSQLLEAAVAEARAAGASALWAGDQPGNYLAPGVDERAADTLEFLEKRGFLWRGATANLRVPLVGNPRLAPRPVPAGYALRPAGPADAADLAQLAAGFFPAWAFEAARALAGGRVWLATSASRDGAKVAFACVNGNNQGLGWFGPTGTQVAHRGRGLGEALLVASLAEQAQAGASHATIAWVGPTSFYERAVGAVEDRNFVRMERPL